MFVRVQLAPIRLWTLALGTVVALAACSRHDDSLSPGQTLSRAELLDPAVCGSCHTQHYAQWSSSPHAAASDDPLFVAMNKQAQRLSGGQVGNFCVRCHAPQAVHDGLTQDGLNLAEVPRTHQGVTCYSCHTVQSVTANHNNGLVSNNGTTLYGGIKNPIANNAHGSQYSALHDRDQLSSSQMCGSCHDVITPAGAVLETTYAEWQGSAFNHAVTGSSCGSCHMPQATQPGPIADVAGAPNRLMHSHGFVGIDTPLMGARSVGFGNDVLPLSVDTNRAISEAQTFLDTSLQSAVCVRQVGNTAALRVVLDNVAAGHTFPSGATHDRRFWVEIVAYQGGNILYQSGLVGQGNSVTALVDPDLWLMRHCMFDKNGQPTTRFWDAADVDGALLPVLSTFNNQDPNFYKTHIVQKYPRAQATTFAGTPDRVTMRLWLQPFDDSTIAELVADGDLDPNYATPIPRYTVGNPNVVEWTPQSANASYQENGVSLSCITTNNLNLASILTPAPPSGRCSP